MRMRPMCLAESGSSSAAVSLDRLLDGATQNAQDPGLTVAALAEVIAKGGWPALLDDDAIIATKSLRDYLTQVSHVDVPAVSGKRRDPAKVNALMRSLARNTATEVAITTLAADAAGSGETMNRDSVTAYLDALDRLMVIEDQPAWSPALRSRVQLRSSPRRHFVDPSLAVAALRASPERLLADLESMGLLFESMVIRDLRVLSQPLDGRVQSMQSSCAMTDGGEPSRSSSEALVSTTLPGISWPLPGRWTPRSAANPACWPLSPALA